MASVAHLLLEREENAMTLARISNSLTVQFAKILHEKRRGENLRKSKKKKLAKFGNLLGIFHRSQRENATVTHRYTQEDENKESKMTWA